MSNIDKEYLARPLLEGVKYVIDDNLVRVASEHTSFANNERISLRFTKESLIELYDSVCKRAKAAKVTVSKKRKYRESIESDWERCEQELKNHNKLFDQLVEAFKIVKERGLHQGTSDDEALAKAIAIRNELETIYYRTSAYMKMYDIYTSLKMHEGFISEVERSGQLTSDTDRKNRAKIYV